MTSHLKSVVEPNMAASLGIFVASAEPCLGIVRGPPAKGRRAVRLAPEGLGDLELPASHAFAVMLCPGDTTEAIASYAITHKVPFERFHFYHTSATNVVVCLQAWRAAGLEVYSVHEVDGWGALNKHFGAQWNNLVHDDFCKKSGCRMR